MKWIEVRFINPKYDIEEMSDVLWELGAVSTIFEDNQDTPIYEPELNKTELWNQTDIVALFDDCADISVVLAQLAELGYRDFTTSQKWVHEEDWANAWKKDFHPMQFGRRLWICPSWTEFADFAQENPELDTKDAVVIKLDPGLAFGTGTHPTTRLCLAWLDTIDLTNKRVVDYGCGSGILAIAALLLGAKEVIALDIDPQAIQATTDNAIANNVADRLVTHLVEGLPQIEQADVVVANILAGPLVQLKDIISNLVKDKGILGLSGILAEKEQDILNAYSDQFDLEVTHDEEWVRISGQKTSR